MAHPLGLDVFRQLTCAVAGSVIAEQPGLAQHRGAVAAGGRQREVQRVGHASAHMLVTGWATPAFGPQAMM